MANYMKQRKAFIAAGYEAGLDTGQQMIMDIVSLVLRDPKIMGKDIFGKERLMEVRNGVQEYLNLYMPAWSRSDEADYYQEKMDRALKEAYGDIADDFQVSYPYAPEFDYMKGRWSK